jgi:hypothetical protein
MLFLLSACMPKTYTKEHSAFILLKSPYLKYADMGFIYENSKEMKVEIYSNGQAVMNLELLEEKICLSTFKCMDKQSFNKMLLSASYPKDLLHHVFGAKAIFGGKNKKSIPRGFEQDIFAKGLYDISYKVRQGFVSFEDSFNDIKIKIKR